MIDENEKGSIAWMARHGVAPNILMAVLILGGFYMSTQIKQEVFPNFTPDTVIISMPFPGATPEEVEEGVILAIEEEIRNVDDIVEVSATAAENFASVIVEVEAGADLQRVSQDIKQAVDRIDTFPEDTREPTIAVSSRRRAVIEAELYGDVDEWTLRQAAEQVRDGLLQSPGISQVDLVGARELEVHIEIPLATLREYGLTLSQVGRIISNSALDRSGGSVETRGGEILLRMQERRDQAREYEDIPIIANDDGSVIRLRDIATIREGFEDREVFGSLDGHRSIGITVFRVGEETPIGVAQAVEDQLPEVMAGLPPGLEFVVTDDDSEIYEQRLTLLLRNGFFGLCLVFLILTLFLEFKLAFWVAMGIPTSFLGALLFLPLFDTSINMVSMFAFILSLGIVVDDAIVAGENIFEHRLQGDTPLRAAYEGAKDIATPLAFSILSNVVAFIPLSLIPGTFGKIWAVIPVVVTCAFAISWIEALYILPNHLAHIGEVQPDKKLNPLQRAQRFVAGTMTFVSRRIYGPIIVISLRWRYLTVAIIITILVMVLSIPLSGRMGFILMPQVEGEYSQATARLPVGAPIDSVDKVKQQLVDAAKEVIAANGGDRLGKGVYALVEENEIEVRAYLVEASLRTFSTGEVTRMWREQLGGEIPGLESLRFAANAGGPGAGANVTIELSHRNSEILEQAAEELAEGLAGYANVEDVDDGFTIGKRQMNFKINEEGRQLGFDAGSIAQQVRASYYGDEPIRQQRGRNEVTVRVRLPENERSSEANLENMILMTANGGEVPLYQVVTIDRAHAFTKIDRRNGRRVVTVSANVDPISETNKVLASAQSELLPDLIAKHPGLSYSLEGRQADMRDSMQSFYYSCTIALFIVYVLLAIPFRSYIQPLIVLTAVPFAAVGAILGHMLMGFNLSMISIMGIIALSGVVVNGGLVMVVYANRMREDGLSAFDAIHTAGQRRFRPIMLTTMTTFGGLAPMIFETSRQANFLIPMAISLGYGILFATFITLLLVPCLYMMAEDVKNLAPVETHDLELAEE